MNTCITDNEYCEYLVRAFRTIFPNVIIKGGADEPFYKAPSERSKATIYFRGNYPRSLLHEVSHYCLAGDRRRNIDDFGYWYAPCGRTVEEQQLFEVVEARPQGLERVMCEIVGIKFSPSLDDFSGRSPSEKFLRELEMAYQEMLAFPPATAKKVIDGLKGYCASS